MCVDKGVCEPFLISTEKGRRQKNEVRVVMAQPCSTGVSLSATIFMELDPLQCTGFIFLCFTKNCFKKDKILINEIKK